MEVSVETTQGLERKLRVQLPAEQFEQAMDERLRSIQRKAKVQGFRPGKVPLKIVRQKYGDEVMQEVLSDLVQRSYIEAIQQKELTPAGTPQFDAQPPEAGQAFEYTATFEVYPEVELKDVSKIKVDQPVVKVTDADVDNMLSKLREQRAEWQPVEREAREGDQVKIDFEGTIKGEPFEGGSGEDVPVTLGSGQLVEGFEEQLTGIKAGEERRVKVTFPKDYPKEALQGKKAEFEVTAREVLEQKLPELDEAFVRSFGAEDGELATLKANIRRHLEAERDRAARNYVKTQVMDGLIKLHKIDVPAALVDKEIEQLQRQALQNMGISSDQQLPELPREPFEEEARRRVQLGLILSEFVRAHDIKADPDRVQAVIDEQAAGYEDPEQVKQYYRQNRELMQSVEAMVVEDQVVDWILEQAKTGEKKMSFDELSQISQQRGQ